MAHTIEKLKQQQGVGLLEVLISMVLLVIGVLGMGMLIGTAIQGNTTSRENTVVNTLIKRQIEYYESLDSLPPVPYEVEVLNVSNGRYTMTTYLTDNTSDSTVPSGLYLLEVDVSWSGQDDLDHSRKYSTYIQEP